MKTKLYSIDVGTKFIVVDRQVQVPTGQRQSINQVYQMRAIETSFSSCIGLTDGLTYKFADNTQVITRR